MLLLQRTRVQSPGFHIRRLTTTCSSRFRALMLSSGSEGTHILTKVENEQRTPSAYRWPPQAHTHSGTHITQTLAEVNRILPSYLSRCMDSSHPSFTCPCLIFRLETIIPGPLGLGHPPTHHPKLHSPLSCQSVCFTLDTRAPKTGGSGPRAQGKKKGKAGTFGALPRSATQQSARGLLGEVEVGRAKE